MTVLPFISVSDILSNAMKIIIYQALARLWGKCGFSSWDEVSLQYVKSLGTDYLWLTGIPRHASGKPFVKGNPGCPYSVSDWKDVNPYLADCPERRMEEFAALVGRVHTAGLKLLMDYVPNHVAKDYEGPIVHYDYCDADWTDTLKNDWSSPATRSEMLDILRFWIRKGVDGFRCDMAELVPPDALGELISAIRREFPQTLFVAEVYGRQNYRKYIEEVGFDLLYDKSGLYDSLREICGGRQSARSITWNWQSLGELQGRMLNFLENHDEQRLASPFFLGDPARSYAALAVSLLFNDASFMLYFGQEAGEDAAESDNGRTSIFDITSPVAIGHLYDAVHRNGELSEKESAIFAKYRQMLGYAARPVFRCGKNWDLCYCNYASPGFDADRHFAFMRYDSDEAWIVFCNFSDVPLKGLRLVIPSELAPVCGCTSVELGEVGPFDAAVMKIA